MGKSDTALPWWGVALGVFVGLTAFAAFERHREQRAIAEAMESFRAATAKIADENRREQQQRQQQQRAADRAKAQAASDQREQEFLAARHRARQSARIAAQIERDEVEGKYFPPAAASIPEGAFACKDRVIVRRTTDSWQTALKGNGSTARCRIEP